MALTLAGSGGMDDEARAVAQAAHDLAVAADARASRAMTKANTIDDRYDTLEELAASYAAALPASVQDRAALHAAVESLTQQMSSIQLTPGPAGAQGVRGPSGVDGVQGNAGLAGATGPSGTASLAIGAASVGLVALGGSTTVTVPLSHAMPDTSYRVEVAHSAVVSLANVTIVVTAKTTAAVTLKVTSVGLAVAAGTLLVVVV